MKRNIFIDEVGQGFHAMLTIPDSFTDSYSTVKAIIPKGAKYFTNGLDEIVANKMEIIKALPKN